MSSEKKGGSQGRQGTGIEGLICKEFYLIISKMQKSVKFCKIQKKIGGKSNAPWSFSSDYDCFSDFISH